MRRSLVALICAVVTLVFVAVPAEAIVYGTPDGNAHPNVGGVLAIDPAEPDVPPFLICSGTLIAPTVFLTAAHCDPALYDLELVGVTFASQYVAGESTVVPATDFVGNPDYDGSPYHDIAVILLAADPGITPANLPTVGALDELMATGPRTRPGLTAVGYGLSRQVGPPRFEFTGTRMRGDNRLTGLKSRPFAGLLMQTTAAPGTGGGTCYGDSGGPFFIQGTNTIVATTITGRNKHCGGADINLRLDTEDALSFLAPYV